MAILPNFVQLRVNTSKISFQTVNSPNLAGIINHEADSAP